jgi:hypothetical protein
LLQASIELQQGLPWFSRLFSKRPSDDQDLDRALSGEVEVMPQRFGTAAELRRAKKPSDPARDELRALVNDAFDANAE